MGFVVVMVIVLHAHHFGELLKGKSAVAVFVKSANDEFATWHADILVFHCFNVFNEVFQFLEGKAAAVVGVRFVEHRHQHLRHVIFHGFFERGVLFFVVVITVSFVLIVVLITVVAMVVIVLSVPCHPELVPGKVAVVVRIES